MLTCDSANEVLVALHRWDGRLTDSWCDWLNVFTSSAVQKANKWSINHDSLVSEVSGVRLSVCLFGSVVDVSSFNMMTSLVIKFWMRSVQINTASVNASDASQSVFGFAAGPDSDRVGLLRRGAVVCVWPNGLPPAVCGAPFRPVRDERRGDCS